MYCLRSWLMTSRLSPGRDLREKHPGAVPLYERIVDRLDGDDRLVPVSEKKKPSQRTDRSRGVVDPRMVVPLKNPLVYSDRDAALVKQAAQMEVNAYPRLTGCWIDAAGRRLFVDTGCETHCLAQAGQQQDTNIVSFGESTWFHAKTLKRAIF